MRAGLSIVLFTLVFAFTTFTNSHGTLAFGWHRFTSYGWPQSWLHFHVTDQTTWVNGKVEVGPRTTARTVDWHPFIVSAGTAAGIASVLSAPVFLWPAKKSERDREPVSM